MSESSDRYPWLSRQTALPAEGEREYSDLCAWCGRGGAMPYEVERARHGRSKDGARVLKKAAVTASACDSCTRRFDREKQAVEDAKAAARAGA